MNWYTALRIKLKRGDFIPECAHTEGRLYNHVSDTIMDTILYNHVSRYLSIKMDTILNHLSVSHDTSHQTHQSSIHV